MSSLLKWILLLCIWNSILFFKNKLGLSVILFIIPLLILIYYTLCKNEKINKKSGLLFIIPIIILSINYLIYDNLFLNILNLILLPMLIILMYIFTIKTNIKLLNVVKDFFRIILKPFTCINKIFNLVIVNISSRLKLPNNFKKAAKSIIIILPLLILIIILLTSADIIFKNLLISTINFKKIFGIFTGDNLINLLMRIILILILFIYISSTINFIIFNYKDEINSEKPLKNKDNYTIKLLLTCLNIIYIIFDFIQIKSLIFHSINNNINYAEYARQGFFQLMFVSIINIIILLISKKNQYNSNNQNNKYINIMSFIMVVLTFIIIISSFLRMNLYESHYGYTLLRLLVYITLITESILLIPTIIYIFNSNFKIGKYYFIILITVYMSINLINIDGIIADRNIKRYYKANDIDLEYLENYRCDNVKYLFELYKNTKDEEIKKSLKEYLIHLDTSIKGFQEFNISKYKADKLLNKM